MFNKILSLRKLFKNGFMLQESNIISNSYFNGIDLFRMVELNIFANNKAEELLVILTEKETELGGCFYKVTFKFRLLCPCKLTISSLYYTPFYTILYFLRNISFELKLSTRSFGIKFLSSKMSARASQNMVSEFLNQNLPDASGSFAENTVKILFSLFNWNEHLQLFRR